MPRKKYRLLLVSIIMLAVLMVPFLWPHHPLDACADDTIILSCYTTAPYSSSPFSDWKLEPGTEAHAQLLEIAKAYPARYAPWKLLADLPLFAPWQQSSGSISSDILWRFFAFDPVALDITTLILDGDTLRITDAAAYRIDPAFADALQDFTNTLDESYQYFPMEALPDTSAD